MPWEKSLIFSVPWDLIFKGIMILRWSETTNFKNLTIHNFFSYQLMAMKLCTIIELANIYQNLEWEFL